jgi:CheY-like chemotaxis protein
VPLAASDGDDAMFARPSAGPAVTPLLVVDDHAATRQLLHGVLSSAGYDVRTATSAEEALGLLVVFRPRLMLVDVQLTGMDGLALARRLKEAHGTRDILVVAMSASGGETAGRRAVEAGCDGFIAKPFSIRSLLAFLGASLSPGDSPPPPSLGGELS